MQDQNAPVRFIRVKGRVIPIRQSGYDKKMERGRKIGFANQAGLLGGVTGSFAAPAAAKAMNLFNKIGPVNNPLLRGALSLAPMVGGAVAGYAGSKAMAKKYTQMKDAKDKKTSAKELPYGVLVSDKKSGGSTFAPSTHPQFKVEMNRGINPFTHKREVISKEEYDQRKVQKKKNMLPGFNRLNPNPQSVRPDQDMLQGHNRLNPNPQSVRYSEERKHKLCERAKELSLSDKSDWISQKIRKLRKEGKPQRNAIAIAISMEKQRNK